MIKVIRKINVVFLNFNNKVIRGISFCKQNKKFVKVQYSTIRLYNRTNTSNQGITILFLQ